MSYRIVYGPEKKLPTRKISRLRMAIVCSLCIGLLIAGLRETGIGEVLWHWMLPGDPAVTEAALSGLVDQIRDGDDFSQAMTVFCRVILDGAQVSK